MGPLRKSNHSALIVQALDDGYRPPGAGITVTLTRSGAGSRPAEGPRCEDAAVRRSFVRTPDGDKASRAVRLTRSKSGS
jgi:hypothetical protein